MAEDPKPKPEVDYARHAAQSSHYRELLWHTLARQFLLYFLPLLLLAVFFLLQYQRLVKDHTLARLEIIAEHQANTLDLFLRERVTNLANAIDEPTFHDTCRSESYLMDLLERLRLTSDAFTDVGVVDGEGDLVAYYGGANLPRAVSYANENWFRELRDGDRDWLITDIYLGFRQQPHFTIAVRRQRRRAGEVEILRSALSPEKITAYLNTLEGANEVYASVVNEDGAYQAVTSRSGLLLGGSPYRPPREPARGHLHTSVSSATATYAYAWLPATAWALVVTDAGGAGARGAFAGMPINVSFVTLGIFSLVGIAILIRARQVTRRQLAVEYHEEELSGQLRQAAKLASVGELAAGIAHEINNPLAIIAEEVGLIKDSMDPELADEDDEEIDLAGHLASIHDAVFRCRDITRKLLTFVRKSEVKLETHHIHEILDDVLDEMLGNELMLSNVQVVKSYDPDVEVFIVDRNQIVQVLINLVKNAIDAMAGGGTLTVRTLHRGDRVIASMEDTGCGMTPAKLERVFHPFFTTKDPGKGTGLGLSVSFSIIKNFGGRMYVDSAQGEGSTFTVELPYELKD